MSRYRPYLSVESYTYGWRVLHPYEMTWTERLVRIVRGWQRIERTDTLERRWLRA